MKKVEKLKGKYYLEISFHGKATKPLKFGQNKVKKFNSLSLVSIPLMNEHLFEISESLFGP